CITLQYLYAHTYLFHPTLPFSFFFFFFFNDTATTEIYTLSLHDALPILIYTTDVRLLLNSSALPFPKLGNLLPTTGLFLGGPIVLLILSLRFHFLLLRLWGSMAALPAVFPDGQTLEKDGPWYLMGLVRRHFRWQGESRAAITAFES